MLTGWPVPGNGLRSCAPGQDQAAARQMPLDSAGIARDAFFNEGTQPSCTLKRDVQALPRTASSRFSKLVTGMLLARPFILHFLLGRDMPVFTVPARRRPRRYLAVVQTGLTDTPLGHGLPAGGQVSSLFTHSHRALRTGERLILTLSSVTFPFLSSRVVILRPRLV